MQTFRVKNFERFQHYKDRAPPWIKLYNELLDDYEFGKLPDASKMHLVAIWLLASRSENKIPFDPKWVGSRINATEEVKLDLLLQRGFIVSDQSPADVEQDASKELAKCLSREREEEETEREEETEKNGAVAPLDPAVPEREYFLRGREVLGRGAGGLIGKLLKAKGGNVALARAAIEQASQKQNPTEYVAAICRGPPPGKPLTEFQQRRRETQDILNDLEHFATTGGRSSEEDPRLLPGDPGQRSEGLHGRLGADVVDLPSGSYRSSG